MPDNGGDITPRRIVCPYGDTVVHLRNIHYTKPGKGLIYYSLPDKVPFKPVSVFGWHPIISNADTFFA